MTMQNLKLELLRLFKGRRGKPATQMVADHGYRGFLIRFTSIRFKRPKSLAVFSALIVATAVLAAAPSEAHVGIVVGIAPPAPIVEPVPAPPVVGYAWRPGHWRWNGVRYVWLPGRYMAPPRVGAVWMAGHWSARAAGWVWVPGHWS